MTMEDDEKSGYYYINALNTDIYHWFSINNRNWRENSIFNIFPCLKISGESSEIQKFCALCSKRIAYIIVYSI